MADPLDLEVVPRHVFDRLGEKGEVFLRRWLDFLGPIARIDAAEAIGEHLGEHLVDGALPAETLRVLLFEAFTNYSILAAKMFATFRTCVVFNAVEKSIPHRGPRLEDDPTVRKTFIDALPDAAMHYRHFAVLVRAGRFMFDTGLIPDDPTIIYATLLDVRLHTLITMVYDLTAAAPAPGESEHI